MTKRNRNVIGSVSGVKAEEKRPDAADDIHSDPGKQDTPERDSGHEVDETTTDPVETDGNLDPVQDQSNETPASDNPTNKEVSDALDPSLSELDDSLERDLSDGLAEEVAEDDSVQLSDEEIAAAAAELAAETAEPDHTSGIAGDDTPAVVTNPQSKEVVDGGKSGEDNQQEAELASTRVDGVLKPAVNGAGHRYIFVNQRGDMTEMDDETAERFYTEPKFYSYTYDAATRRNVHVDFLRWADENGNAVGGKVGDHYELDE